LTVNFESIAKHTRVPRLYDRWIYISLGNQYLSLFKLSGWFL